MDPLLTWAQALGFPVWAIIILIAWIQLRTELRGMGKEWRQYRIDMERRVTWLEAKNDHLRPEKSKHESER